MSEVNAPNIRTVDDCDRIAHETLALEDQIANIAAECTAELKAVRAKHEAKALPLQRQVDRNRAALSAYVIRTKAKFFPPETPSTRTFAGASILCKANAPSIQFLDGQTKKTVLDTVIERFEVLPAIERMVKRQKVEHLLRIKCELDISGLAKACKMKKVTDEQLAEIGLKFESRETVSISKVA